MSVGFAQLWLPELDDNLNIHDLDRPDPDWNQIIRCAGSRLSYSQSVQLNRIIRERRDPGKADARILILSSDTCQQLAVGIENYAMSQRLHVEVKCGAFGQFRNEVFSPTQDHLDFDPDIILLSLSARELRTVVALDSTSQDVSTKIDNYLDEIAEVWHVAKKGFDCAVFQQTYVDEFPPVFGSHDAVMPGGSANLVRKLNAHLCQMALRDDVIVVDIAGAASRDGLERWLSPRHFHSAKMVIGPVATNRYGQILGSQLLAFLGKARKCLVLDLDNTLWGGEVGDLGVEGVNLGPGDAAGEAFQTFQAYIKTLKDYGVILAVCSKNEMNHAKSVFDQHADRVLKWEDFAAFEANWDSKPQNLTRIAKTLNLGLDSMVFVDDNAAERLQVRMELPDVAVPEMPADPAFFEETLSAALYFDSIAITSDDRRRGAQYEAEALRAESLSSLGAHDQFLKSLDMKMVWGDVSEANIQRVVQLLNKTNQFRTAVENYSVDSVRKRMNDASSVSLQFRLRDRFGDNGITSVLLGRQDEKVFSIDQWVMSCRVFKRDLEFEILNRLALHLPDRGVREIRARFVRTERNAVVEDLFRDLSFKFNNIENIWRLDLSRYESFPTEIEVVEEKENA